MDTINLYGASGHALVVMEAAESAGLSVGCLYDDAPHCADLHGHPVVRAANGTAVAGPLLISIGSNRARRIVAGRCDVPYATVVASTATISPTARVGEGSVVMHGAIVQADARIGRHCIVNTGASVDHECVIGDFVHIAPHATLCGNVHVDEGTLIGAGTTVIPGIRIGAGCTIGAGSVVVRDIPDGATACGNPCRVVK